MMRISPKEILFKLVEIDIVKDEKTHLLYGQEYLTKPLKLRVE